MDTLVSGGIFGRDKSYRGDGMMTLAEAITSQVFDWMLYGEYPLSSGSPSYVN